MRRRTRRGGPVAGAALAAAAAAAALAGVARAQNVSISTVAANGYAAGDVNSCAIGVNTLTTAGNYQFIAYYNSSNQVQVARRALGTTTWQTFNSGFTGATSDDHDVIAMAVDSAGKMHLSWGMHNVALKYAMSDASVTTPTLSSIAFTTQTAGNAPTLFAGPTGSVTYPQFYHLPAGSPDANKLLFTYRNGSSGSGNQYFNVYDPASNTWTNSFAIDGDRTSVNAYLNSLAYTSNNNLLMSWTWRATPSWQTNSDIMFAQSPDNGTTWYRQGGTTQYGLPIIQNTSNGGNANQVAQVVKAIPQNSSFINQTSMTVDANDHPLIATWWAPNWNVSTNSGDPNRQYMLVYYDGTNWRTSQITNRTSDDAIDTSAADVRDLGRPIVLTDDQGRVLVVTRSQDTAMGAYANPATSDNEIVVYYNTVASLDGGAPAPWKSITLDTANMGSYEPTYDAELWKSQRKLSLFYQQMGLGQASSSVGVLDWDEAAYFAALNANSWNGGAGGTWELAANWTSGVPNAAGAIAKFGTGINPPAADSTVTLSGTKTLGTLVFDSPTFHYTLANGSGGGSIALNNGAGVAASVSVNSGSHTIAVPVSLPSAGTNITTASGTQLSISGNISGSGGIAKSGGGTLALSETNSYSGTTTVTGGALRITTAAALSNNSLLSLNGGVLQTSVNVARTLGSAAGQIQLTGGASGFSAVGANASVTLSGGGSITWGSSTFNPSSLVLNDAGATNSLTFTNNISFGNVVRSVSVGASSATLGGVLSGTGGLTKDGAGALVLSGSSTYTGGTTLNAGLLDVTGSIASTSSVTFNSGGSAVLRVETGGGVGSGTINIASNGAAFGPTSRLELAGGLTLANPITLAPRNNPSVHIESVSGSNTLSGPITIVTGGGQSRVQADGAAQLTLAGTISTTATSSRNLYLQGAGAGTISGAIVDNGSNSNGKINVIKEGAGTWTLAGANTYTGTPTVNAGTLHVAGSLTSSSLIAIAGGTLKLDSNGSFNRVIKTPTIAITGDGRLDLDDNKLILTAQAVGTWNGSAYTGATALVASGYSPNGDFSGSGVVTSQSNATGGNTLTSIGVASNADLGLSSFGGQSIGANDTLVMYTYGGDANLDGVISGDDYFQIDSVFPTGGHGWFNGDFNYDGIINGDDYFVIDSNFPQQGAAIPTSGGVAAAAATLTAVPEPAAIGLLALPALGLARRSRRSSSQLRGGASAGTRAALASLLLLCILCAAARADDKPSQTLVAIDQSAVASVHAEGATCSLVTDAGVSWCSVTAAHGDRCEATFAPSHDVWDLSSRAMIEVPLRNPTDQRIFVRVRAENPDAKGLTDTCSTGIHLMPHENEPLTLRLVRRPQDPGFAVFEPFYMYASAIHVRENTVDPAQITRLVVSIDHPKEGQQIDVGDITAAGEGTSAPAPFFPFVDPYGQYLHSDWFGKIHDDADFAKRRDEEEAERKNWPGPQSWDKFGGWGSGATLKATGFFYAAKHDGKWWLVDPEGRLFWSYGPTGVGFGGDSSPITDRENWFADLPPRDAEPWGRFYRHGHGAMYKYYHDRDWTGFDFAAANLLHKYGDGYEDAVSKLSHDRLRSWGFNSIGNWSSPRIYSLRRTPYTVAIHYDSKLIHPRMPDVYDESFERSLRARMEQERGKSAGDAWNIGYFVDNERWWGWRPRAATVGEETLKNGADAPAKKKFLELLKTKYDTIAALNNAWGAHYDSWDALASDRKPPKLDQTSSLLRDCGDFGMQFAERYFSVCRAAVKSVAPDNLYLGCRFNGHIDPELLRLASRYCDVISYNIYDNPPDGRVNQYRQIDAPVLASEWGIESDPQQTPFRGKEKPMTPSQRADVMVNYLNHALRLPNLVGAHFFQYRDQPISGRPDGEAVLRGFVNIADTPNFELIQANRRVAFRLYETRTGG
jgi:autotransporter-associated beta strand protein